MPDNQIWMKNPYYTHKEWLGVFENIFQTTNIEAWKRARVKLRQWSLERNVPAFISATLSLLDAQISLHFITTCGGNSCQDVKEEFYLYLVDYVNQVIKMSEKENDRKDNLLSLHQLASLISLPLEFVDLRNELVHERVSQWPPLTSEHCYFVRKMSNWIREQYWDKEEPLMSRIRKDIIPIVTKEIKAVKQQKNSDAKTQISEVESSNNSAKKTQTFNYSCFKLGVSSKQFCLFQSGELANSLRLNFKKEKMQQKKKKIRRINEDKPITSKESGMRKSNSYSKKKKTNFS